MREETDAALEIVEAEWSEFRDGFATPELIPKDYSFGITIALSRKSGQPLEAGKRKLEHIEEGERQQSNNVRKASTKIVAAFLA